jgi:nitroreductase
MEIKDIIMGRRSIRLFEQKTLPDAEIRDLLDCARTSPCASNLQQLRFIVIQDFLLAKEIFQLTAWANLVKPHRNPQWGVSAPRCFIAVIADAQANPTIYADAGAAIQSMQIMAWSRGIGCCWLGSIKRDRIKAILELPEDKQVMYLLALGYPAESPLAEDIPIDKPVYYYLDDENRLHVPKLCLDDVASWR